MLSSFLQKHAKKRHQILPFSKALYVWSVGNTVELIRGTVTQEMLNNYDFERLGIMSDLYQQHNIFVLLIEITHYFLQPCGRRKEK